MIDLAALKSHLMEGAGVDQTSGTEPSAAQMDVGDGAAGEARWGSARSWWASRWATAQCPPLVHRHVVPGALPRRLLLIRRRHRRRRRWPLGPCPTANWKNHEFAWIVINSAESVSCYQIRYLQSRDWRFSISDRLHLRERERVVILSSLLEVNSISMTSRTMRFRVVGATCNLSNWNRLEH